MLETFVVILCILQIIFSGVTLFYAFKFSQRLTKLTELPDDNAAPANQITETDNLSLSLEIDAQKKKIASKQPAKDAKKDTEKKSPKGKSNRLVLAAFVLTIVGFVVYQFYGLEIFSEDQQKTQTVIASAQKQGAKTNSGAVCIEQAFAIDTKKCENIDCRRSMIADFAFVCLKELARTNPKATAPPCGMRADDFYDRFCKGDDTHQKICEEGPFSKSRLQKTGFYCPFTIPTE